MLISHIQAICYTMAYKHMSHYLSSYGTFALVSAVEGSVLLNAMHATVAVTVAVVVVCC